MTDNEDPETGRVVLGRYRIIRLLARGGMGAVYLARVEGAAGFSKPVVIKRILPHMTGATDEQAHFIREARILSQLRHPGIVDVIDFGREGSALFMILEYVPGHHLGQWLKYVTRGSAKMPWDIAVYVMIQVLTALHYAHTYTRTDGVRTTIVHRDISPSNILIDVDGNVRLVDFGIARIDAGPVDQEATKEGEFRGKLPYAAPEQLSGGAATPSSDTYSCAVVLYQLLAGENPFIVDKPARVIQRVLKFVPALIDIVRGDVPAGLGAVLAKALAKAIDERYASAQELASALRAQLTAHESEIASRLTAAVRADFRGGLPRALSVPSVTELEVAWRRASGFPVQAIGVSMPTIKLGGKMPSSLIFEGPALLNDAAAPTAAAATGAGSTVTAPTGPIGRWLLGGVAVAVVLASFAAFFSVWATRTRTTDSKPRFVVVESSSDRAHGASSATTGSDANAAPSGVAIETASAAERPKQAPVTERESARPASVTAQSRDPSSELSRAFGKKQGAIQGCFQTNALGVQGAPQITIRFSVDAHGKVVSATVQPQSIATTSLGQCLARVASSTNFGSQSGSLTFSIPITARVR